MTLAWELCLAVVCAAVVIGPGYVVGRHHLDQRRHARTLANIARLEIELGYEQQPPPQPGTLDWMIAAREKATNYSTQRHNTKLYRKLDADYVRDYLEQMRRDRGR